MHMHRPAIMEIGHEFVGKASTQLLQRYLHLLVMDFLKLCDLVFGAQTLPWKGTTCKVEEHIAQRLQVVPSTLLHTVVIVNASIPTNTNQSVLSSFGTTEEWSSTFVTYRGVPVKFFPIRYRTCAWAELIYLQSMAMYARSIGCTTTEAVQQNISNALFR